MSEDEPDYDDAPPPDDEEQEPEPPPKAKAATTSSEEGVHTGVKWGWKAKQFLTGAMARHGVKLTPDEMMTLLYKKWGVASLAERFGEEGERAFTLEVPALIKAYAAKAGIMPPTTAPMRAPRTAPAAHTQPEAEDKNEELPF